MNMTNFKKKIENIIEVVIGIPLFICIAIVGVVISTVVAACIYVFVFFKSTTKRFLYKISNNKKVMYDDVEAMDVDEFD